MRIINQKKKSDFIVRTWHDAREAFDSLRALRLKLIVTSNDTESSSAKVAKQSVTDGEPPPAKKAKHVSYWNFKA